MLSFRCWKRWVIGHSERSTTLYIMKLFCEDGVWVWWVPQASGCVLEDGGPLSIPGLRVLIGLRLPARVWDDDLVGHGLQRVVYDHHFQRLVRGQIPQRSWQSHKQKAKRVGEEPEKQTKLKEMTKCFDIKAVL